MNNQLVPLSEFLNTSGMQRSIQNTLKDRTPQFIASVISLSNTNPKLAQCDRASLINACLTAAVLSLPINQNLGYAWIIPYENKREKKTVAQFQMGWKGFVQLAMRTGQYLRINVREVKEGEFVGEDFITGDIQFAFLKENRGKAKTIGYVAFFKLTNGFEKVSYMTVEEILAHAGKYSKAMASGYGPWKDEFEKMAKKTVLKLLISKYGPMSDELEKALVDDQAVISDDRAKYLDNEKQSALEVSEEKERVRLLTYIKNAKTITELEKCQSSCIDDETVGAYQEKERELQAGGVS